MTDMDDLALVDRFYEAAVLPELWPEVLQTFAAAAGAEMSILIAARGIEFTKWILSSPDFEPMVEAHTQHFTPNIRTTRLIEARHAGFLGEHDIMSQSELDNEPLYREFLRPNGFGFGIATAIFAPSGDSIIVHAEYAASHGPASADMVARLDRLRPSLARAALLSSRLGLERAEAMTHALEAIGLPGAVLRHGGRVLAANRLFDLLMPAVVQDRSERVSLTSAGADVLFADVLAQLSGGRSHVAGSIPIPAVDGHPAMIAHLLPVRGAAQDIFAQANSLLIITPVDRAAVPTAEVLQGLFDLTPAEARIARAIGQAQSVENFSTAIGVSRETVRSQLKSVLAKTGMSRQQELVNLLAGVALPRSPL